MEGRPKQGSVGGLTLAAIGVVYGDIGTSPLYTLREAFGPTGGVRLEDQAVLGILSLIVWALLLVVSLKYVIVILRADNKGEGGVLALAALAQESGGGRRPAIVGVLAVLGAALFYGDGIITPAISVLSAVEGLKVVSPVFERWVVPVSATVLVALFVVQRVGTGRVGRWFGPVICLWFVTLGGLGLMSIVETPGVLRALSPLHAAAFIGSHGWGSFVALGAVVLAVTGSEALYADMGHFGRLPIRLAWFGLVLPGLVLNYFGQGALLLRDPSALANPFYHLAPGWAQAPLVALATAATVIASQAVISGVFSITRQAVQLGYLPRMGIRHTSVRAAGQVYVPRVNALMLLAVLAVVAGFGSSSNLAAAYGIAVTGAMIIDGVLVFLVALALWRWKRWAAGLLFGCLLGIDLAFFGANALKIPAGGWFPLLLAALVYVLVSTWRMGREALAARLHRNAMPLEDFVGGLPGRSYLRFNGTAVFLSGRRNVVPRALLHNLKHNGVLHSRVVIVTVTVEDVPYVDAGQRVEARHWGHDVHTLFLRYGFMDRIDVPDMLVRCGLAGTEANLSDTHFFLSREVLIPSAEPDLSRWREGIFIVLAESAQPATEYFGLPPDRVVELATQLRI